MLSAPKSAAEPYPRPGTLIYFAEFSDRNHGMRAMRKLCARSPHHFTPPVIARGRAYRPFGIS